MDGATLLEKPIEEQFRVSEYQKMGLDKLGIMTVRDLLWHFPSRLEDFSNFQTIRDAPPKTQVVLEGKILKIGPKKTWKKKLPVTEATIADATGKLRIVWFHQPYVARMLREGELVRMRGKVSATNHGKSMANPLFEKIQSFSSALPDTTSSFIPIYPETRGITSRWLQAHIMRILKELPNDIEDILPADIRKAYNLPHVYAALLAVHAPRNEKEAEGARKRFAFEEIFLIQLSRTRERKLLEAKSAPSLKSDGQLIKKFTGRLRFTLTRGQQYVLDEIAHDLQTPTPMARLLEGDVGSGKTVIAAITAFITVQNGYQAAYMAPTEILARQHLDAFSAYFAPFHAKIGLLTSSECRVFPSKAFPGTSAHIPRSQLLRWVKSGEISILIGTHALIQKHIVFKNLAFIVVDEQHRFGIRQRAELVARGKAADPNEHAFGQSQSAPSSSRTTSHDPLPVGAPHFLSMTATPIPRTLALTIYGDLDLSVLDELPPGRIPVETIVADASGREKIWESMRDEIKKGRQAFVICPRIEDKDDEIKSVEAETKRLGKEVFPELRIKALHGKLTPREKEKIMREFKNGDIDVLVATTVIEVGIDIPNASLMLVEGAERFGLAQLHQLRGRIGRGGHASTFFALSESGAKTAISRLTALRKATSGFELAEYDLDLRGAGELTGGAQWGISDMGMEALKNIKMVEAARKEARRVIGKDQSLKQWPLLQRRVAEIDRGLLHFE